MFGILNALVGLILCFKFEQEIVPACSRDVGRAGHSAAARRFCVPDRIMDYSETLALPIDNDLFHLFALSAYCDHQ